MTSPPPGPAAKASAKPPAPRRKDAPQRDLFQLDSPLIGEIRGERSLMHSPFSRSPKAPG